MGFSRQEYWSGLPLPSPTSVQKAYFSCWVGRWVCNPFLGSYWWITQWRGEGHVFSQAVFKSLKAQRFGLCFFLSWASLVAQLVKNPPAMWETWVRSLGWEDPLEKGKATHSSILWPGEFHGLYSPWGRKESNTTEWLSLHFKAKEVGPTSLW